MVRPPSYDCNGMKKGAWSEDEDNKLRAYIMRYGHWNWRLLPKYAGLARCGKSCRLRWVNYLKPGVKKGNFTKHEKDLIVKLHSQLGNKWSAIATKLPGRTDNDIKNYWNAHIDKRGKHANKVIGDTVNQEHSDIALWETYVNESASFDALPKLEDPTLPFDTKYLDSIEKPQVNFLPDTYQTDYITTLLEEGFFWGEPIVSYAPNLPSENSYKVWPENDGGLYDPCLPYFDHGMVLL